MKYERALIVPTISLDVISFKIILRYFWSSLVGKSVYNLGKRLMFPSLFCEKLYTSPSETV